MGNASSTNTIKNKNNSKLANEIDKIAGNYIVSQTYNDMNKLSEKEYCDKLVILTAKILNKNLNDLEKKEIQERLSNDDSSK
jgi:hypothetical protein